MKWGRDKFGAEGSGGPDWGWLRVVGFFLLYSYIDLNFRPASSSFIYKVASIDDLYYYKNL